MTNMTKKSPVSAYGYVRVSTEEQEENEISIESQISAVKLYAAEHGLELAEMFVEGAMSGRKPQRPAFMRMIDQATAPAKPVKAIIAFTQSRFVRNLETHVTVLGRLKKAGVEFKSVTQNFGKDSTGDMLRNITAMFDEHFSKETAAHTRRTMKANAEDGFYNGGPVPLGYEARTVEVRGKKEKRKLFIKEDEVSLVRLIFDLADFGRGDGPMGGRAIAEWLNENGYRNRGSLFYNGQIAAMLARSHYTGRYPNMTIDDAGAKLPEEEWIWVECPAIIDPEQAARIASSRARRAPRVTAPRFVSGPTLLAGKVVCGMPGCGAGMVMATGKSGRYRYYRCNKRTNFGASSCGCPAIRVEKLDEMVTQALVDQLFGVDRLHLLLQQVLEVSDEARERNRLELTQCEAEITRSQTALSRLLDLVAQGIMSSRDPALAEKIATHRSAIASMQERTDMLTGQLKRMANILTDDLVERFSSLIRAKLRDEDPTLRRNYVRLFVDKVIVGNQSAEEANALKVVIQGSRSTLEGAAFAASASKTGKVPIFDREWCGREDSNFHGLSPTTTSTLRVYHSATTAYRRGTVSQSRKKGAPWVGGRP